MPHGNGPTGRSAKSFSHTARQPVVFAHRVDTAPKPSISLGRVGQSRSRHQRAVHVHIMAADQVVAGNIAASFRCAKFSRSSRPAKLVDAASSKPPPTETAKANRLRPDAPSRRIMFSTTTDTPPLPTPRAARKARKPHHHDATSHENVTAQGWAIHNIAGLIHQQFFLGSSV